MKNSRPQPCIQADKTKVVPEPVEGAVARHLFPESFDHFNMCVKIQKREKSRRRLLNPEKSYKWPFSIKLRGAPVAVVERRHSAPHAFVPTLVFARPLQRAQINRSLILDKVQTVFGAILQAALFHAFLIVRRMIADGRLSLAHD
jgi:hypothetical protein